MSELCCNGHYAFTLLSSAHYTTSKKKPNILDFYFLNSNHKMQTCRPPLECIKRQNICCITAYSLHHRKELDLLMTKSETLNIEDIQTRYRPIYIERPLLNRPISIPTCKTFVDMNMIDSYFSSLLIRPPVRKNPTFSTSISLILIIICRNAFLTWNNLRTSILATFSQILCTIG